jgi:hypothetical protein
MSWKRSVWNVTFALFVAQHAKATVTLFSSCMLSLLVRVFNFRVQHLDLSDLIR